MAISTPELKERLNIPASSSNYPALGNSYKQAGYPIEYSHNLTRTGKDYYNSKARIPKGYRMTTAAEELAIQLELERSGADPRKANVFDDLFARNDSHTYVWQWTETGLRVPKGYKADKFETGEQGRKYWPRIVLIGDKEIGEILVPEGGGRVAVEWDEVFGIPKTTENIDYPHNPYTTHFWFNSTPAKDDKSGNYDVAVGRGSDWRLAEDERCLGVGAGCGRWGAYSGVGFRPVRGSASGVEKELSRINPNDIERTLLEAMKKDYRSMTFPDFLKKYEL